MKCKNQNRKTHSKVKPVLWCIEQVNIPGVAWSDYNSETAFQIYCADWLRKRFEITKDARYSHWHHSANERIGARQGFLAKMKGQAKGWPDFVHCGARIALELKVESELRPEQSAWLDYFRSIGWIAETVFKFERFRDIVVSAGLGQ